MTVPIRGFAVPFHIDPVGGGVETAVDADKIATNLRTIFGTRLGERPMLRDFGSQIHALVHEVNDPVLARSLTKHLQEALLAWERRVIVTDMSVNRREGEVEVVLRYRYIDAQEEEELAISLA